MGIPAPLRPARPRVAMLAAVVLLAAVDVVSGGRLGVQRTAHATTARPNILVIVTDDERTDEMASMPLTRGIFADGGTSYTHAYVETPLCCPSRATIMTGRYSHNHHVTQNTRAKVVHLDFKTTLAHYLRQSGYQTAITGKFFNGWPMTRNPPYYNHWSIMRSGYDNATFNVDGTVTSDTGYSTDFVRDKALEYLSDFESRDRTPWFMYVAPFAPHWPYTPATEDEAYVVPPLGPSPARTEVDRSDKPPAVQDQHATLVQEQEPWIDQNRSLQSVDRMVQSLFEALRVLGEENTIAFFISDNGYLLAEHGIDQDKLFPYTPAMNVPMYMRWPGHVAEGAVDPRRVLNADIAPTALDAARVAPPTSPRMDGRSLLSSMNRDRTFVESFAGGHAEVSGGAEGPPAWATDITDTYEYTEWYAEDGTTVTFREYYDLVNDPDQLTNLLHDGKPANNPPRDVLRVLHVRLAHDRTCHGTSGSAACP